MAPVIPPKITVIFPLFFAAEMIEGILTCLAEQAHPLFGRQADWMEVLFIDNASTDSTVEVLRSAIEKHYPAEVDRTHLRIIVNEANIGLSRSLNKAFELTRTPFALTCHSDCRFGRKDYVAQMLELMETNPKSGAITGQTAFEPGRTLPLTEKVNLVANLMDLFQPQGAGPLVSTGFAEGRCDAFRVEAVRAAGYYDTTLRLAGEDQILAARMRENGYEIYQAPALTYFLSVSIQQDSLRKLARHQQLFGRAHPYIVLATRNTHQGTLTASAGRNRQARTLLRLWQLTSAGGYCFALASLWTGLPIAVAISLLALIFLGKILLFWRHLQKVEMSLTELIVFWLYQPILDLSYSLGLAQGIWLLIRKSQGHEIS